MTTATAELPSAAKEGDGIVLSEGPLSPERPPVALRIEAEPLPTPRALREQIPGSPAAWRTVRDSRETIRRILRREDRRFLVVVGPCSIHDVDAAREYAGRLAELRDRYEDRLYIVMRAYFEKPRTAVGWRGLLSDPHLDGSFDLNEGLRIARRLLGDLGALGLPAAAELLDTDAAGYYADLVGLGCVGARTTESQPHRALASALDLPVGFKNGTDGTVQVAVNAMRSARERHNAVAMGDDGRPCAVRTAGNPDTLLVLRGGAGSVPNYDADSVAAAEAALLAAGFAPPAILVDASHANSGYDPDRQPEICLSVAAQRRAGRDSLLGVMIESHLVGGKQPFGSDPSTLRYGVSVTDACLGWNDTAALLKDLYGMV